MILLFVLFDYFLYNLQHINNFHNLLFKPICDLLIKILLKQYFFYKLNKYYLNSSASKILVIKDVLIYFFSFLLKN